jgi:hypothetical protein
MKCLDCSRAKSDISSFLKVLAITVPLIVLLCVFGWWPLWVIVGALVLLMSCLLARSLMSCLVTRRGKEITATKEVFLPEPEIKLTGDGFIYDRFRAGRPETVIWSQIVAVKLVYYGPPPDLYDDDMDSSWVLIMSSRKVIHVDDNAVNRDVLLTAMHNNLKNFSCDYRSIRRDICANNSIREIQCWHANT